MFFFVCFYNLYLRKREKKKRDNVIYTDDEFDKTKID